jgi:hypothetical protein
MCDMCVSHKDLCVYRSWVACLMCQQQKVRCSFLNWKWKHKDEEIDSDEEEEPTSKRPKPRVLKPSGPQQTVLIPGPSQAAKQPVNEMVVLLRELVEGVWELTKVTRGVSGLGVQIYQQNAKLIRLGERQSYLAEKALKGGSGSGSGSETEAGRSGIAEARTNKGKGKAKMTEEKEETMRSDGDSGSGEEEEDDARMKEDVGSTVSDLEKEK